MRDGRPRGQPQRRALVFGPDNLLYIGTGDGGGGDDQHGTRGNGQSLSSPLGKLLRIDPRAGGGRPYRVPSSNPFVSREGARPEIYAYGLRNPWRFSFDRRTGDLAIGDVGQNAVEEIDFVRRGRGRGVNWGWRPFEGTRRNFPDESAPGARDPVIEHSHDQGFCSITGGYIVRDPKLPSLRGRYVYGDYCEGHHPLGHAARRETHERRRRSTACRRWRACPRSARTRAAGCTPCRSTGRCTASIPGSDPRSSVHPPMFGGQGFLGTDDLTAEGASWETPSTSYRN